MSINPTKMLIFIFRGAKRGKKNLPRGPIFNMRIKLSSITPQTKFQAFIKNFMKTEPKNCKKTQILKFRGAKRRQKNLHRRLKLNIHIKVFSITLQTKFQAFISKTFWKRSLKPAKMLILKFWGPKEGRKICVEGWNFTYI